jgi:hypothetical protein
MQKEGREQSNPVSARKRTGWIWAICIAYLVSTVWSLLSLYLIFTGKMQMTPSQRMYFSSFSQSDLVLSILIGLVNLCAIVALFRLRRIAFYLLATTFAASIVTFLAHGATTGWFQTVGGSSLAGAIIGLCISAAVCMYAWMLMRRGALT